MEHQTENLIEILKDNIKNNQDKDMGVFCLWYN